MRMMTPAEVADLLHIRPSTLEAWRLRGTGPKLPFAKIGHAVRYREDDVLRLIEESTHDREAAA